MSIISGVEARVHLNVLLEEGNNYTHPTDDHIIGGYFLDKSTNKWVAFDNSFEMCTVEEFIDRKEAVKYAYGIEATLDSGMSI